MRNEGIACGDDFFHCELRSHDYLTNFLIKQTFCTSQCTAVSIPHSSFLIPNSIVSLSMILDTIVIEEFDRRKPV